MPEGTPITVDIDVTALSLRGIDPIIVTYNGGQNPEQWDTTVDLSTTGLPPQTPQSTLTATKTHCNGGSYVSTLYVQPRLTFTKVLYPNEVRVLDTGIEGIDPILLEQILPAPWTHDPDPDLGAEIDTCSDFHAGIEETQIQTECDCNSNGIRDKCDIEDCLPSETTCQDCNGNGVPDGCDLADGGLLDCNVNGIPDECERDCNFNGITDDCDVPPSGGYPGGVCRYDCSLDCNENGIPDECEIDCNLNSVADDCDVTGGTSHDCNANGIPDECEPDCNDNGVPDDCDIAAGTSMNVDRNTIPDECYPPLPTGACCLAGGVCRDPLSQNDCVFLLGGVYRGDDTVCGPGTCVPCPGDYNGNGVVDLDDYAEFQACFRGPVVAVPPACEPSNFDGDTDVDLFDFANFQQLYGDLVCAGACCLVNGTCLGSLTQSACTAQGGTYQGNGTTCTPNPCPQPPATLLSTKSWKTHGAGGTAEEFFINLPLVSSGTTSPGVETRMSGDPLKLTFGFNNSPQLPVPPSSVAYLKRSDGSIYNPTSASVLGNNLTINWAAVLNAFRYVVCLNVLNLTGDSDVEIIAQLGNVYQEGLSKWYTDDYDAWEIYIREGQIATQSNCKYDITQTPPTSRKRIDESDRELAHAAFSGPVQGTPVSCP